MPLGTRLSIVSILCGFSNGPPDLNDINRELGRLWKELGRAERTVGHLFQSRILSDLTLISQEWEIKAKDEIAKQIQLLGPETVLRIYQTSRLLT